MSSPWGKIVQPESVNLMDIMSEEVAKEMQAKEDSKFDGIYIESLGVSKEIILEEDFVVVPPEILSDSTLEQTDAEIAKLLQQQFDKEYDTNLKRTEDHFNRSAKVTVSFSNYRRATINNDFESDSEEEEMEDLRDRKDWDRFDTVQRAFGSIPPCGYKTSNDGSLVTKHDAIMCSLKNACKLMSFPPDFETGDGAGFDFKLSNQVFNKLKTHSKNVQLRRHRIRDKREDQATAEFGLDEYTRLLLYKMINNKLLERVNGVISIGKEAVILHADSDPSYEECVLPKECVIKVFKTTLSEFKQRDRYIKDDYRFKDRVGKQSARKTVHLWAEKEMHNLMRVRKAGIPCPEVVALRKHVLVMSFIGADHRPAPKLKDTALKSVDYIMAYDQIVTAMKALYSEANLVHADLSEYNILWHEKKCFLIDVSQSVEPSHENAFHFLMRDCKNITNYFSRKGIPGVASAEELFMDIVGCEFGDKLALLEMQESFKMKPHLADRADMESSYNFDNAWQKTMPSGSLNTNVLQTQAVEA